MLPTGHAAAGFLTAFGAIKILHPNLTPQEINYLYFWGIFWGTVPDLDLFVAFAKIKGLWYKPGTDSGIHRKFYFHIPLFWLLIGMIGYLFSSDLFWQTMWIISFLGCGSHLLFDSIEYGIPWLWPVNNELWALKNKGINFSINAKNFLDYWLQYLKIYITRLTFFVEITIIFCALIIFINL